MLQIFLVYSWQWLFGMVVVPLVKDGTKYVVILFSEWIESIYKDVEYSFGIF